MKIFFAIPVFCLFAGVSAPGDEAPAEKAVSVILLSATSKIPWEPGIKKGLIYLTSVSPYAIN